MGLILTAFALLALCASTNAYTYKTFYFNQTLDHFSLADYGTEKFSQRYLLNDDYVPKNSSDYPIFFYSGNEGRIEGFWEASGAVLEHAKQYNALVIFGEHRFYGNSIPFGSKAFTWPYVGLLTVEQAMADYVELLLWIKEDRGINQSKIISFGGSYGGMLSAYLRFKYPNVIDGALAASAPVRLADSALARSSFWTYATKDYLEASSPAVVKIRQGFADMQTLANKGTSGLNQLSQKFSLCTPMKTTRDYTQLLYMIRNAFTSFTMFDYPYPTDFSGTDLPGYPVVYTANMMLNADTATDGIVQVTNLMYNTTSAPVTCFDPYTLYIACADPTGCGLGNDALAWDFQVCYEISLSYGSNNVTDMFPNLPWTEQDIEDYCKATWNIYGRHEWFAVNFWGSNVWAGSNIIWSNGLLDPWHYSGILSSNVASMPTVILQDGAHHLDLRASNKLDPQSVTDARTKEATLIGQILDGTL